MNKTTQWQSEQMNLCDQWLSDFYGSPPRGQTATVELLLRTDAGEIAVQDMACQRRELAVTSRDGVYARFMLPKLEPWQMLFVVAEPH